MGARVLNAQFLTDLETRMQVIQSEGYADLTAERWWDKAAKVRQSTGKKEVLTWMLSTAMIRETGPGGNIRFDDLVSQLTEIENKHASAGLRLNRDQLEDTDGGGVELAAEWSRDIGAYMAYWPQKQVAKVLKEGHTSTFTAYDGKTLFAADHPLNPYKPGVGTFANVFTGAASGSYPGALPIDTSVTLDVAQANLAKLFGYIASIKMPNGEDPRNLRPAGILCSPTLFPRAAQAVNAEFIAQGAASGGGSADVKAFKQAMGYGQPILCPELAGYESDTTFFVVAEQVGKSQLGGIIYQERKPFRVDYYGAVSDAELGRMNEFEWQTDGRNAVSAGHPYLIFKVKAS